MPQEVSAVFEVWGKVDILCLQRDFWLKNSEKQAEKIRCKNRIWGKKWKYWIR